MKKKIITIRRKRALDFWRKEIEEIMNEEMMNRLADVLEALAAPHTQRPSRIVYLMKEIQHIPTFEGKNETLSQFFASVETYLNSVEEPLRAEIWQAIYNTKIIGRAKELLLNNRPEGWEATKVILKQHFRPICSYKDISRKICNIKVSSIQDLNEKIETITQEINQFATYESNPVEAKQTFYTLLINRIKQLVSGNLSREIKDLYNLHLIKDILYSYVGYDNNNIDREFISQDRRSIQNSNNNHQDSRNWRDNNNNNNNPFRQNNYNSNQSFNRQNNKNFNNNFPRQNGNSFFNPNYIRQNNNNFRSNNNNFNPNYNRQNNFNPNVHRQSTSDQYRQNVQPVFNPSGQIRNAVQNPTPMSVNQTENREEEIHNLEFFLN